MILTIMSKVTIARLEATQIIKFHRIRELCVPNEQGQLEFHFRKAQVCLPDKCMSWYSARRTWTFLIPFSLLPPAAKRLLCAAAGIPCGCVCAAHKCPCALTYGHAGACEFRVSCTTSPFLQGSFCCTDATVFISLLKALLCSPASVFRS